ncbi:MAG: hypothetical protein AB8G11_16295, partial [Saprospiraceae bacterium]
MKRMYTYWVILLLLGISNQINAQCNGLTTLTTTTGTISDGSGPGVNYQNGQSCQWLIQPTGGGVILLSFS